MHSWRWETAWLRSEAMESRAKNYHYSEFVPMAGAFLSCRKCRNHYDFHIQYDREEKCIKRISNIYWTR